jgi:RNA polymerase sigma factor (sigma-70 family)
MIKTIRFKNKNLPYDTETRDGFDEILNMFDRKIIRTVSGWVKNIPDHDIEDLSQICRMKLVEALEGYNDKANIYFSTYVYTVWHRKLSQLSYKYKTKKYSTFIKDDNYISFNYAYDKISDSFYLMTGKNKCPINKKVIDCNTCKGCEFSNGYLDKIIEKGALKGEARTFTKCGYFRNILDQRGVRVVSIDQPVSTQRTSNYSQSRKDTLLSNILTNTKDSFADLERSLDLEKICENLDPQTFIILQLIIDGFNKSEIIKKTNISSNRFNKCINKLGKNDNLKKLIK